jgi:hypothetical protein
MFEFLQSALLFLRGVCRRVYVWGFALFLDPVDLYDRFRRYFDLTSWPELNVPNWLGITVLFGLLFWSAIATYHELRKEVKPYSEREVDLRDDLIAFLVYDLRLFSQSCNEFTSWLVYLTSKGIPSDDRKRGLSRSSKLQLGQKIKAQNGDLIPQKRINDASELLGCR